MILVAEDMTTLLEAIVEAIVVGVSCDQVFILAMNLDFGVLNFTLTLSGSMKFYHNPNHRFPYPSH